MKIDKNCCHSVLILQSIMIRWREHLTSIVIKIRRQKKQFKLSIVSQRNIKLRQFHFNFISYLSLFCHYLYNCLFIIFQFFNFAFHWKKKILIFSNFHLALKDSFHFYRISFVQHFLTFLNVCVSVLSTENSTTSI